MASGTPSGASVPTVELNFKNPSKPLNESFQMQCPLDSSIGQLKQRLVTTYPGNPTADTITASGLAYLI